MRDKTHAEHLKKWAEFVRTHPRSEWKPQVSALVDSQLEMANAFYARLAKTKAGHEKMKTLRARTAKP